MSVTILKARVYVGTYGKYNSGNIYGDWMRISDYPTKASFYAACRELHKDEKDPELMFPDHENIPEGMISESSISDEVWHVINSIKKYNLDKADEFAEWCEENGAIQGYKELCEFLGWNKKKKKEKEHDKTEETLNREQMMDLLRQKNVGLEKWEEKYYQSKISNIMLIKDGIVIFEKPEIETRFCFDDENKAEMETYYNFRKNGDKYFLKKNLECYEDEIKRIDKEIREIEEGNRKILLNGYYIRKNDNKNIYDIKYLGNDQHSFWVLTNEKDRYRKMEMDELKKFRKIQIQEMEKFKKRLTSYLKRYGTSKCRVWSYWANA